MPNPQYIDDIEQVLRLVQKITKEVKGLLPREVSAYHWVRDKISPTAWKDTAQWYMQQDEYDITLLHYIDTLDLMTQHRIHLQHTLRTYALLNTAPNLQLAKVRRTP